ncbi:MAG: iron-siderophore ABC transporter substrate-binding protein [Ilumatobacteraceae bacterium]
MRATARRSALLAAVAVAAALVLAACGGDGESSATTVTTATTAATTTAPSTTEASTATTAASTTAAPSTTVEATTTTVPGPHVVTHAMGETEVPGTITRLVVLDSSFLDAAIALGVTPVAATEGVAGAGLPAYLGDATAQVQLVGQTTEPNLEQIAAMRPDLILGAKVRHEAIYDQLSAIAPTVFSESSGTNWTEQVRLTGESLNRAGEAAGLLADFDARAKDVGAEIGAPGTSAVIVRFIPGQIRLYGPATFSGSVLTAVGFDLGDKGYDPSYGMAVISAEQVDMLDTDVIFATNPEVESGGATSTDRGAVAALWSALPAVQNGRQFDILDSTWMTGIGVIGANAILDDLEAKLG